MLDVDLTALRGEMTVRARFQASLGETVALVGPNGAGKSTILHALCGLVPLQAGRVVLGDEVWDDVETRVRRAPYERSVGVVFQDLRLFDHLTVADNIAFGLAARGLGSISDRVREVASRFGISASLEASPKTLSGGQRQLVALARAVAGEPRVLLLDEPTASLDAEMRPRVRSLLREVLADPQRVNVLVTHEPADALNLASRVVVVEEGATGEAGTVRDIARRPVSRYAATFVGVNLLRGEARFAGDHAEVTTEMGIVHVADPSPTGTDKDETLPVDLVIHPTAVTLSIDEPHSSARNVFRMQVRGMTATGARVRVDLGPLTAEVTPSAVQDLDLKEGNEVYAAIKATQIELLADERLG
ncbi:MAG: ABC transporter ATP-binding protein [Actinomycetota bacterium]